jgi:hypothetical protein
MGDYEIVRAVRIALGLPSDAAEARIMTSISELLEAASGHLVNEAIAAGRIRSADGAWWRGQLAQDYEVARTILMEQMPGKFWAGG